jgi:ArsR family transcriptional regulator, zinc-responsive transcriptional repressor
MINDNTQPSAERADISNRILSVLDAEFFKALCEPARVAILKRLIQIGRSDVKTIAQGLKQDRSVISRHLAQLERAGILASQKMGRRVEYDVNGPDIISRVEDILALIAPMATLCVPFQSPENEPQTQSKRGAI